MGEEQVAEEEEEEQEQEDLETAEVGQVPARERHRATVAGSSRPPAPDPLVSSNSLSSSSSRSSSLSNNNNNNNTLSRREFSDSTGCDSIDSNFCLCSRPHQVLQLGDLQNILSAMNIPPSGK